jgi:hypothetical protein
MTYSILFNYLPLTFEMLLGRGYKFRAILPNIMKYIIRLSSICFRNVTSIFKSEGVNKVRMQKAFSSRIFYRLRFLDAGVTVVGFGSLHYKIN